MKTIDSKTNNADAIVLDLIKVIGAKAEYHPELKVITRDPRKMYKYICEQAGDDNDKLRELQGGVMYIRNLPIIKGLFMKTFGGYNKI